MESPEPHETVNMDFNSTTPMDYKVVEAVKEACANLWSNPSSSYATGCDVKKVINESRKQVAKMINCEVDEIIFTSGGTESNNWVIYSSVVDFGKARSNLSPNSHCIPHIISTNVEHDSIRLILEKLMTYQKIEVTFVEVSKLTGFVSAEDVINSIRPNTVLISVMLANNETGILQPVAKIAELLVAVNKDRSKIYLHTDAAQAIGKLKIDVDDLGVDYLTIVGHKFYAPRIGALYRRSSVPLQPIFFGGNQESGFRSGN